MCGPEEPEGPYNARKLLRETPLVRIHLGGAPRVYRKDEPFITKREQTGLSNLDGEAVEAPVNSASLTLTAGAPLRSFSLNYRDPTLPAPVSIAESRTEFVRYTQLVVQLDSERLDRQAQQRAASDEMRRWSYRHGQGFILSEEQRRRQADAAEMVKDKGALLANAYAMAVETGLKLCQKKPLDPPIWSPRTATQDSSVAAKR